MPAISFIPPDDRLPFARDIAALHLAAFPSSHFTTLFSIDLLENYYSTLLSFSDVVILAFDAEAVVGFIVAGTSLDDGVSEFVSVHRFSLATILLKNPSHLYFKIISALKLFSRRTPRFKRKPSYRLFSICVSPGIQGTGLGSQLLSTLDHYLASLSISSYGLSVKISNSAALSFYRSNGFLVDYCDGDLYFLSKRLP
jgi:ribosomal protein S18 acetylase RimI-like enzyme